MSHDAHHIEHGGAIPTSSAFLSVSLKTGAVIAILSDQPRVAPYMHQKIQEKICSSSLVKTLGVQHDQSEDSALSQAFDVRK